MIIIVNGKLTNCSTHAKEKPDRDLRALPESWQLWLKEGFGFTRRGPAVAVKKLQFAGGNYRQTIRNPSVSHPFLQHFELIKKLATSYGLHQDYFLITCIQRQKFSKPAKADDT